MRIRTEVICRVNDAASVELMSSPKTLSRTLSLQGKERGEA